MRAARTSMVLMAALAICCACSKPSSDAPSHESDDWWRNAIASLTQEQKRWYEADKAAGKDSSWMLTAPNPPASDVEIADAEARAGVKLDEQYKEWLRHTNGWRFFSGGDSLYPTGELSKDSRDRTILLGVIDEYGVQPGELEMRSFEPLVVIGGASGDYFIAAVGCEQSGCATAPVWEISGGDHVKYGSFQEFLQARIDRMKNTRR